MLSAEDLYGTQRFLASVTSPIVSLQDPLVAVDQLLWAHWLQRVSRQVFIARLERPDRGGAPPILLVACSADAGAAASAFSLGPTENSNAEIEPRAMRAVAEAWTRESADSVTIVAEDGISPRQWRGLRDTLSLLEALMSIRGPRPMVLVLFASEESLRNNFPIRWTDHRYGDYSLVSSSLPSASFIAQRNRALSIHELVHQALSVARHRARAVSDPIPYFAEEALARMIGGAGGVASRDLSQVRDASDAFMQIRSAMDRDANLEATPFVSAEQFGTDLETLGAVFRVALVRCKEFPASVLAGTKASRIQRAVMHTAVMLGVPQDSVVGWAATALATRETLFVERARARSGSVDYAICK